MIFKTGVQILIVILIYAICTNVNAQQIQFVNGNYKGIVIGIDGSKFPTTNCSIIQNLELVLPEFSKSLEEATSNKARIGMVQVLLPYDWDLKICENSNIRVEYAPPLYSCDNSHFKITENHPLAGTLPWTKQYKPCSQGGDNVVLPVSFLTSSSSQLTNSIKGKFMLFEWAKFRYGVFDEIGYAAEGEDMFSACYTNDKQAYLATCSSVKLPAVALNESACSIEFLMKNGATVLDNMKQGPTSVMAAPYIDQSTTNYFCNDKTHNRRAETKQNHYCDRKSVSEIIYSHPDFRQIQGNGTNQDPPSPIEVQYLKHERKFPTAYAFVIEDSMEMRESKKLLHVKQAISQFLEIIDIRDRVEVQIILFSEDFKILSKSSSLYSIEDKSEMLNFIPDGDTASNSINYEITSRQLSHVIDFVTVNLSAPKAHAWNVFLFSPSASNIIDMDQSIRKFQQTLYSMSVISFEDVGASSGSQEWLKWYGINNTKKVIVLPYCKKSSYMDLCSLRTTSFIVQHLTSYFNDHNYDPRAIQKVAHVEIKNLGGSNDNTARFTLSNLLGSVKQIYFLMTVPANLENPKNYVELLSPDGSNSLCTPEVLFPTFGRVIKFSGPTCQFMNGEWMLRLKSYIPPSQTSIVFDAFLEYDSNIGIERPIVVPSLGFADLTKELQPNSNFTSVYVSVMTKEGNPILDADVFIQIYHPGLLEYATSSQPSITIALKDDGDSGNGADQTMNDGVYSGYLSGYSTTSPSFHLSDVQVLITQSSKILTKIQSPQAALLQDRMTEKCCGHKIKPLEAINFQHSFSFMTFLPGFKIMDPWTNIRRRPGRIGRISSLSETDLGIQLEFVNVVGDISGKNVSITSIQACCVPRNDLEEAFPNENDCKADTTVIENLEPPGERQTVYMNKVLLVDLFLPSSQDDRENVGFLICQFRAVNSDSEFGALSSGSLDVNITAVVKGYVGEGSGETECKSINDDCLPILIFWILIGCVALLVLLLILVLICCWCCHRKKKDSPPRRNERREETVEATPPPRLDSDYVAVKYNKNHTTPNNTNLQREKEEPKVVKELFVNHAYIQDGDGEIKIIADSGEILRKPLNTSIANETSAPVISPRFQRNIQSVRSPQEEHVGPSDNMQVYKPTPNPKPSNSHMPKPITSQKRRNQRPEIIHANPMLRADSVQNVQESIPISSVPVSSSTQDPRLVYATVSRAGRPRPMLNQTNYATINHNVQPVATSPHYMVPHSSIARPVAYTREPLPNPAPPKVQPYPSSSDSDSPHSPVQAHRRPPRFNKPPPYPSGSQIGSRPQSSQNANLNRGLQNSTMRPTSISPALPVQPPVPPPRFERNQNESNPLSAMQTFAAPRHNNNLSDEDSDQWDDGDNFEYNPGDSYA